MEISKEFTDYLFKFWLHNYASLCEHCKNYILCDTSTCPKFESYEDCETFILNPDGSKSPLTGFNDLSCTDINFGECPMLEDTPCNGCIENEVKGFEFNGVIPDDFDSL